MGASTAWSVQIRMMTASNAPKMFAELAKSAKTSGVSVERLESKVKAFARTIESARFTRAFDKISRGFTGIEKSSDNFAKKMGTTANTSVAELDRISGGMGKVDNAFRNSARYAGGFARTMGVVSRASSTSLNGVASSLNTVRSDAYAAAGAVRTIASAARSIPRTVRINYKQGPGAAGLGAAGAMGAFSSTGAGTMALAAGGLAAGGVLIGGIAGAGRLQGATLQAAIATGRMGSDLAQTTQNMADFRQMAFRMSTMTGQSISDSMGVIATMASAGVSTDQLKAIYKPIAQFTDILHFGKDQMGYGESAGLGAGLVHDMRLMNSTDTAYGLGRIAQLGYLSPHGTTQLATQVRRMAPMLENVLPGTIQNRADQITLLAAWADRMGNLPFAGSAIGQMTTQMISPRSKRVLGSLETLGVYDAQGRNRFFDQATGTFDVMGALMQVQKHMDAARKAGKAGPAVEALFGGTQNMQRIMMALTSKESLAAYKNLKKQMTAMGTDPVAWMNKVQGQLMGQLNVQTMRLTSDFGTLQSVIGEKLLPSLTPFVSKLADVTEALSQFLSMHPNAARAAGVGLGVAGVAGVAASLAIGGYVAGSVLHRIPGVGRLMVGLGHHVRGMGIGSARAGTGILGLGRGLMDFANLSHLRGFLGSAARYSPGGRSFVARGLASLTQPDVMRDMAAGIRGIPGVRGLMSVFDHIGGGAKFAAGALNIIIRLFGFGAANLLRLGARAIPVVGDILLLIDALKFLGSHSHDIGKGIGMAAKWIVAHGLPMLLNAFKGLIGGIFDFIMGIFRGGPSGLIGTLQSGWRGLMEGWNYDAPKPKGNVVPIHAATKPVAHAATGGYTRGEGLTYLHKNELIVNDKLTRKLERLTSGNGGAQAIRHEHRVVLEGSGIPSNPSDLRKLAHMIADILSVDVAYDSRAGGSIPQMSGHSFFDIAQGMPA